MERLTPRRLEPLALQDAAKRILLLDCDHRRREARAEALMSCGALVDCAAETVVARTLWKPGAYDLLLIDMRGADADCANFISLVYEGRRRQKVGFYVADPPYVTASVAECPRPGRQQTVRGGVAMWRTTPTREPARLRTQVREQPQVKEVREGRSRGISAPDPVKLSARALGSL